MTEIDWVRRVRPRQPQQIARLFDPNVRNNIGAIAQKPQAIGLTLISQSSPGDWSLQIVRRIEWQPLAIGSGMGAPAVDISINTGELMAGVSMLWPSISPSGNSPIILRRGVSLHVGASEVQAKVAFILNAYDLPPAPIDQCVKSDTLTAWLAPSIAVPYRLPDVIVGVDVPTYTDYKAIPLFARRARVRARSSGAVTAGSLLFSNPENAAPGDVVPVGLTDSEIIIPGDLELVAATPAGLIVQIDYEANS